MSSAAPRRHRDDRARRAARHDVARDDSVVSSVVILARTRHGGQTSDGDQYLIDQYEYDPSIVQDRKRGLGWRSPAGLLPHGQ